LKKNIFVLLVCLLIPLTVYARPESLTVDLEFKPRDNVKVHPKNVPSGKIFFEPVQDTRSNPKTIGENLENKDKKVTIKASNNNEPTNFVRSVLIKEFRDKKFSVEDNAGAAAKIIAGTLIKFWTVETSQYDSQTQLKIDVKDRTGRVHFSRTYTGVGKNRGRSLSDINYDESISNSMTALVDKVFSDQDFLEALSERGSPPAAEAKPAVAVTESQPVRHKKIKKSPPPASAPSPAQPAFGPK
jgi:hypothetical protein